MLKNTDTERTAPTFAFPVTGNEVIDLALRTTEFPSSLLFTSESTLLEEEYPVLHNVVASFVVGCTLNLDEIASKARNVEYNPKRSNALVMRIRNPKTTALCFKSGKLLVMGAKSEANCRQAGRKFARIMQKLGYPARFIEFKVLNLVATAKTNFPIRLETLLLAHQTFAHYEPEIFPGLIYRIANPKVVLIIFASGHIVFTGAKEYTTITSAFRCILPVLQQHKRTVVLSS
jgi:transcription initiation factor TFIID TATA-box-binding protein